MINIYNTKSGQLAFQNDQSERKLPFSYVRWRPTTSNKKTRNVYATVNSEGDIQQWSFCNHRHMTSGKCLSWIKTKGNLDP